MARLEDGEIIPNTDDAIGICNSLTHLRNTLVVQLGAIVDELEEIQLTLARGQRTMLALPSGKAINLARITHVWPSSEFITNPAFRAWNQRRNAANEAGALAAFDEPEPEDGEISSPLLVLMFGSTSLTLRGDDINAARTALGLAVDA